MTTVIDHELHTLDIKSRQVDTLVSPLYKGDRGWEVTSSQRGDPPLGEYQGPDVYTLRLVQGCPRGLVATVFQVLCFTR